MTYYMILDGNGNELCNGLSEQTYATAAQRQADSTGQTVWAVPSDAAEDDDGEAFDPS